MANAIPSTAKAVLQDTRGTANSLRVTEIFLSLQGESNSVGRPTVFVRTTGCPLRCTYCDTAYAFSGGTGLGLAEIVARVRATVSTGSP